MPSTNSEQVIENDLTELEIPSGLAREAAKVFPNDLVSALDYCLKHQASNNSGMYQSIVTCSSSMEGIGERYNLLY